MRAINLIKLIGRVKFRSPKHKADVMIWDTSLGSELASIITRETFLLHVRGEVIYLRFLIGALARFRMRESLTVRYSLSAIQHLQPKLVITGSDNSLFFYRLKALDKNETTKFAAVQNARRFRSRDLFDFPAEIGSDVDTIFVFSETVGQQYLSWLQAHPKIVPIGSLKANIFTSECVPSDSEVEGQLPDKPFLGFISEFHARPKNPRDRFVELDEEGSPVYHDEFYSIDSRVIQSLAKVAIELDMEVVVALRHSNSFQERRFFKEHLGEAKVVLISRSSWSSYLVASRSEVVVTVDSTMGYEAFALGSKVYLACCRLESRQLPSYKFGWPKKMPECGHSFQNYWDEDVFISSLYKITRESKAEFDELAASEADVVMTSDKNSAAFRSEVERLIER